MSENREKKEKMTAEARAAAAERLEEALGALPPRYFDAVFGAEAAAEEKKSAKKTRNRTAPAWLRPVAACLAVLLLGGLVVFSIPVVNNIISRRAPAELPGTDVENPTAEADSKEEETEKKEETEKPGETEEVEVSLLDKKIRAQILFSDDEAMKLKEIKYVEASFNDLMNYEKKQGVATSVDAAKISVGMTVNELIEIMGCPPVMDAWALDDGRKIEFTRSYPSLEEVYQTIGLWDAEKGKIDINKELPDDQEFTEEMQAKIDALYEKQPIHNIIVYENPNVWESLIRRTIEIIAQQDFYKQGLTPEWEVE